MSQLTHGCGCGWPQSTCVQAPIKLLYRCGLLCEEINILIESSVCQNPIKDQQLQLVFCQCTTTQLRAKRAENFRECILNIGIFKQKLLSTCMQWAPKEPPKQSQRGPRAMAHATLSSLVLEFLRLYIIQVNARRLFGHSFLQTKLINVECPLPQLAIPQY